MNRTYLKESVDTFFKNNFKKIVGNELKVLVNIDNEDYLVSGDFVSLQYCVNLINKGDDLHNVILPLYQIYDTKDSDTSLKVRIEKSIENTGEKNNIIIYAYFDLTNDIVKKFMQEDFLLDLDGISFIVKEKDVTCIDYYVIDKINFLSETII